MDELIEFGSNRPSSTYLLDQIVWHTDCLIWLMIGVFIVGMPLPVNWAVCWPSSEEKGKLSSESVTSWSSCVLSWVGAMDTVEIVPDLCKPVASCGMISEYVSSSDSS